MKKIIVPLICLLSIGLVLYKFQDITNYLASELSNKPRLIIKDDNEYKKDYNFKFVSNKEDYIPYSKQDLINIIYSVINNGWDQFTFYCPSEYTNCVKDMTEITDNQILLAHINNYVHPYNSYDSIRTSIMESGEISLYVYRLYTQKEIDEINQKVDEVIKNNFNKNDTDEQNLKRIHDYIINNTKYDIERNNSGDSKYKSYMAYGIAINGYATCNGYADYLAIILSKLGYENYKIATTTEELGSGATGHVWNAVKVNNKWLHIDLTWDDPVSNDGSDHLYHKYFLVNNAEMAKADDGNVKLEEHKFNRSIYLEYR